MFSLFKVKTKYVPSPPKILAINSLFLHRKTKGHRVVHSVTFICFSSFFLASVCQLTHFTLPFQLQSASVSTRSTRTALLPSLPTHTHTQMYR
jgi:hypothetical protein